MYANPQLEQMPTEELKAVSMGILKVFFLTDYDIEKDFYEQFDARLDNVSGG